MSETVSVVIWLTFQQLPTLHQSFNPEPKPTVGILRVHIIGNQGKQG